jgi:hypothetical protein
LQRAVFPLARCSQMRACHEDLRQGRAPTGAERQAPPCSPWLRLLVLLLLPLLLLGGGWRAWRLPCAVGRIAKARHLFRACAACCDTWQCHRRGADNFLSITGDILHGTGHGPTSAWVDVVCRALLVHLGCPATPWIGGLCAGVIPLATAATRHPSQMMRMPCRRQAMRLTAAVVHAPQHRRHRTPRQRTKESGCMSRHWPRIES